MKLKATILAAATLLLAQGAMATPFSYDCVNDGGGCPIDIPTPPDSSGTITSTITVGDTGTIADLNVALDITHTFDGDLDIFLTHDDTGTMVELTTDNGGSGDDYIGTIFDDAAGISIVDGSAPFTGTFAPEGLLAAFNGEDIFGTWTLTVIDDAGGDIGVLLDWGIFGEADMGPMPTPEPGVLMLLGLGLAGLGFARRRS